MSEDYTYPTTPTLADLRARVAELERQLAQADSNMVAQASRNAELAARLDAVPVEVIKLWFEHHFGAWERYWPDWVRPLGVWLRDTAGFATNKEGM